LSWDSRWQESINREAFEKVASAKIIEAATAALLSRLNQLLEWECVEFGFCPARCHNIEKPRVRSGEL